MYTQRRRIDLRLPSYVIEAMDNFCAQNSITRTFYIETLIRQNLKNRVEKINQKIKTTWDDIEDIPLMPEYE